MPPSIYTEPEPHLMRTPLMASSDASKPSRLSRTLSILAWGTTLALTAVAVLRLAWFDGTYVLIWLNAFTAYVYLPAYACLAWALGTRRWRLAGWSAVLVIFHLSLVLPAYFSPAKDQTAGRAAVDPSKVLRIFYGNVRAGNTESEAMFREIDKEDPDLVVLVEFSRAWRRAADESPILNAFPYRPNMPYSSPGVFSKLPIENEKVKWSSGRQVLSFDVSVNGTPIRIVSLHGPRPIELPYQDYFEYWREVPAILAQQAEPCIVVGDLNATPFSKALRDLKADGWKSAHEVVGRGYATTWPSRRYWAPPIRIDHALFRGPLECLNITEGVGSGSDHRPLVVDFVPVPGSE